MLTQKPVVNPCPAHTGSRLDELEWLGKEKHNYGHLLRVTIPRNPALLVVRATLKDLAAYSADFVPPEALDTLASYLLSWAATIAPFDMLTAEQLLMAAASDDGALQAARILSRKQRGGDLTFATARQVLVQNVCRAITRAVKQAKEGLLSSSIVQRFLLDLPLRLLVLLLGRLFPLLRSTATTGSPLLEASGKTSGKRAGPARIMHTMAKINQKHSLGCIALSAEVCGLRHYRLTFWPPITSLAHFHPMRKPPQGSKPDGNVRFLPGTLLLLEVSFAAPHAQGVTSVCDTCWKVPQLSKPSVVGTALLLPQPPLSCQNGPGHELPARLPTVNVCDRLTLIAAVPGSCSTKATELLRQVLAILRRLHQGCSPLSSMKPNVHKPNNVILQLESGPMKPVLLPPGVSLATSLTLPSSKCLPERRGSRCLRSPSMHLGGGKPPCTTSRSMCTMSCA